MDENDNGELDEREFREGLQKLGFDNPEFEELVPRALKMFDKDGDGAVEIDEFLDMVSSSTFCPDPYAC